MYTGGDGSIIDPLLVTTDHSGGDHPPVVMVDMVITHYQMGVTHTLSHTII